MDFVIFAVYGLRRFAVVFAVQGLFEFRRFLEYDMTDVVSEVLTSTPLFVAAVTVYLSPSDPLESRLALNNPFVVAVSVYLVPVRERLVVEELTVVTVFFQLLLTLAE